MPLKTKIAWGVAYFLVMLAFWLILLSVPTVVHAKPPVKSKFYDFSAQIIDGEIRKPTVLYTDIRERVRFERLLKLKKSFMRKMFQTSKERVFK